MVSCKIEKENIDRWQKTKQKDGNKLDETSNRQSYMDGNRKCGDQLAFCWPSENKGGKTPVEARRWPKVKKKSLLEPGESHVCAYMHFVSCFFFLFFTIFFVIFFLMAFFSDIDFIWFISCSHENKNLFLVPKAMFPLSRVKLLNADVRYSQVFACPFLSKGSCQKIHVVLNHHFQE